MRRGSSGRVMNGLLAAGALGVALAGATLHAQGAGAQPPDRQLPSSSGFTIELDVEPSDETATLVYLNRPIVTFRARMLGRPPSERVTLATRVLDELVAAGRTGPVGARTTEGGTLVGVGLQLILGLSPPDIDELAGDTLPGVTALTVERLQQVLDEAAEARRPAALMRAVAIAVLVIGAAGLVLWALGRAHRRVSDRLAALAEKAVAQAGLADQQAASASHRLALFLRRVVLVAIVAGRILVAYGLVSFTLRLFPYTRPWGESLRGYLLQTIGGLGMGIVRAIPGLFTVFVIGLLARFSIKLLEPWFEAAARGTVRASWIHPETAKTTKRLVSIVIWLFAAAMAFPYLPGSDTDAFRGISVFVGLMVTLGSSGLVNQLMSGIMITYSRALRPGDFVKIGDVEGIISHLGVLSTKVRTLRSEDVTIPNAVVVSHTTTDYSRFADSVLTATSVLIGYGTPWRQVEALLLQAAERTPGIRREPRPRVLPSTLDFFGVKYTLAFCLERQESRIVTMAALHTQILDLFNQYGVQITAPHYSEDPKSAQTVPEEHWFAEPAGGNRVAAERENVVGP